jgi:hypothetical protein
VRRWLRQPWQLLCRTLQLGRWLRGVLHRLLRQPRRLRYAAESQRDLHERIAEPVSVRSDLLSVRARSGRWRRLLRVHLLTID